MSFIKYSDGNIKKVFSEPVSSEELADLAVRQIEKEAQVDPNKDKEKVSPKPKWAE